MTNHLFNADGSYFGMIDGDDYDTSLHAIPDTDMPPDWYKHIDTLRLINGVVSRGSTSASVDAMRQTKIDTIKTQVRSLLDNSAWRVERAAERDQLGIDGETPQQVYAYREAVRQAGDRAIDEINALSDIDDIISYELEIRATDYPVIAHLTHLQFLRRFSADERANITKLRAKSPQINDYFALLELAKFVNPYDPDVILGVNTLEQMGVIGVGRAGQILNGESV